jgi:hypothetical protein
MALAAAINLTGIYHVESFIMALSLPAHLAKGKNNCNKADDNVLKAIALSFL